MKLLLDENLSDRIVPRISDLYPDSSHVKTHDLARTDDGIIWSYARQYGFIIVSKDSDFYQRSLVHGAPPKFIFLRVGNCPTRRITYRASAFGICHDFCLRHRSRRSNSHLVLNSTKGRKTGQAETAPG